MPIYRDRQRGAFVFEFDRSIPGAGRVRARKRLPKAWNQAQADAFDRKECARLYALATGTEGADALIEDAVTRYLSERVPHLKAGKNTAQELAGMAWCYVGRPLSALPDVVKAYKLKARKEDGKTPLAPATLRNRIRYLLAAARWGWREHGMCEHDPAAGVTVPQVKNERQVYRSRADMLRAARAMHNKQARMALRIAFYSGMRLGEILRADPRGTAWVLEDTKNGNPRIVPIHPRVAVCARRFNRATPKITIQRNWENARDKAGLQGMHFHDWRHSAASELINAGVDLYTVGRVLGHKDSRSTARYSHLAVDSLTAAVAKIGKRA
jgi:integrase